MLENCIDLLAVAATPLIVRRPLSVAAAAVIVPAKLLVVPTNRAFCVDIPPAVMIEPVVVDVLSVVSVELTPFDDANAPVTVKPVVAMSSTFAPFAATPILSAPMRYRPVLLSLAHE